MSVKQRAINAVPHEEAATGEPILRVRPLCYNPHRSSITRLGGRMKLDLRSRIDDEENPHYADDEEEDELEDKDDDIAEADLEDDDLEDDDEDDDDLDDDALAEADVDKDEDDD